MKTDLNVESRNASLGIFCLRWKQLRSLGESPVTKIAAFFPIFGYLVIYSKPIQDFVCSLNATLANSATCTSPDILFRLHGLFLGALLFSGAAIIYQIRCPRIQKEYASELAFIKESESNIDYHAHELLIEGRPAELSTEVTKKINEFISAQEVNEGITRAVILGFPENHPKLFLMYLYNSADESRPIARMLVTMLFYAGFVLLVIPDLPIAVAATRLMWTAVVLPALS